MKPNTQKNHKIRPGARVAGLIILCGALALASYVWAGSMQDASGNKIHRDAVASAGHSNMKDDSSNKMSFIAGQTFVGKSQAANRTTLRHGVYFPSAAVVQSGGDFFILY